MSSELTIDLKWKHGSLQNLEDIEEQDGVIYFAKDDNYQKGKIYYDTPTGDGRVDMSGSGYTFEGCAEIFNDYRKVENDESAGITQGNIARGNYSHAEGSLTTASGDYSHAEGYKTTAEGAFGSHAEGVAAKAIGVASHAEGGIEQNISTQEFFEKGTEASGISSHAEGVNTMAKGNYSHAEGHSTQTLNGQAHAEGAYTKALGYEAHAEGYYTQAVLNNSHSEGNATIALGKATHAEGLNTTALGFRSHIEGDSSINALAALGVSVEDILTANPADSAQLMALIPDNNNILTAWEENPFSLAKGTNSHVEGRNNLTLGIDSHAEGYTTRATGNYSHSEGDMTQSSGQASHAEGGVVKHKDSNGNYQYYGVGTIASGDSAHSEGCGTAASGYASHAEGGIIWSSEDNDYVYNGTAALGHSSHAEGYNTSANAQAAHAEGIFGLASGQGSHVEGIGTSIGLATDTPEDVFDIIAQKNFGKNFDDLDAVAKTFVTAEVILTYGTVSHRAEGEASHAEGTDTKALGKNSHAEGNFSQAAGGDSHAEGSNTQANAGQSHAEGYGTQANAAQAHAEGYLTVASGNNSHAEGNSTTASNSGTHAEGYKTTASGSQSHAEGHSTTASGNYSHAEGQETTASGESSHAEGYSNTSSGTATHAEGKGNSVEGLYGHVGGSYNTASGTAPFVHGYKLIGKSYQTVIGKWNAERMAIETGNEADPFGTDSAIGKKTMFMIGCGTGDGTKRNTVFRITANGTTHTDGKYDTADGADFAEYFEWVDQNLNNENRLGLFVTLEENKIRLANLNDNYILGAISSTPAVTGNSKSEEWSKKYLKGVFDEYLLEDVEIPEYFDQEVGKIVPTHTTQQRILNPNYNSEEEYIPREDRKEWAPVGLCGQIIVIDDGTCEVNGYCRPYVDGIASSFTIDDIDENIPDFMKEFYLTTKGFRVIERLDENHIRIIIK